MKYSFITICCFILLRAKPCLSQNIGINTTDPDHPLTITTNAAGGLLSFRDNNGYRWNADLVYGKLRLFSGSATPSRLSIQPQGQIGINKDNPDVMLDVVNSSGAITPTIARFYGSGSSQILVGDELNGIQLGADATGIYIGCAFNRGFSIRTTDIDRFVLKENTGFVGVGENNPQVSLQVNGAIVGKSKTINVGAGLQTIDPGNYAILRLNNPSGITASIILGDGLADGQILTIVMTSTGAGQILFADSESTNTQLSSNYLMGTDDTLTLAWIAPRGKWIEMHRSVN